MTSTYIKDKDIIDNEISPFLDEFFYNKPFNLGTISKSVTFQRVTDKELQNKGVDGYLKDGIAVDEKIATHYVNSKLNTFAFEMSYVKNNKILDGWLFGDKYSETIYYVLGYVECKNVKEKDWRNIKRDNIEQIDLIFVKKESIHNFLRLFDITKENYLEQSQNIREYLVKNKTKFIEKNTETNRISWILSQKNNYNEEPLNILIDKSNLCELAQYCFKVTRNQIKMVDKIN